MCAIIAWFIRDPSTSLDYSNLAYITSVFIGYIGTDSDWFALSNASLKKPEQKMVEINNQRSGVPRYAGVVGGNW